MTEFLLRQRKIVDEYRRPDQFVTHNFDYEWRYESFGFQPEVDQFQAAKALTVAGCDIYHRTEDRLTGAEIAFCGAIARGLKKDNYLVLETQAQGIFGCLPYPGQLRLQAFSHLANGADCVEYWHWHSIHNGFESYWKGLLSHDMTPSEVYQEAATIGQDLQRLSPHLLHLKKQNRVAVMVSSRSQAGLDWFPTCPPGETAERTYSDYIRWLCDSLYRLNIEYDIISDEERDFSQYALLVLPCLYAASDELLSAVQEYVRKGGNLLASFRTGFADQTLKIRQDRQPHGLSECLGIHYDRFTTPQNAELSGQGFEFSEGVHALDWIELLKVDGAHAICKCHHPAWGKTAAVTLNHFGTGYAVYLGCYFEPAGLDDLLRHLLPQMDIAVPDISFPLIHRSGVNQFGRRVDYYFNYSGEPRRLSCPCCAQSLLDETYIEQNENIELPAWGMVILEWDH